MVDKRVSVIYWIILKVDGMKGTAERCFDMHDVTWRDGMLALTGGRQKTGEHIVDNKVANTNTSMLSTLTIPPTSPHSPAQHLGKDTAHGPHVHCGCILATRQHHLGSTIPPCCDISRHELCMLLRGAGYSSCHSEVAYLGHGYVVCGD